MTHTLRPYPEYKASGIGWFEDIPSHWQLLPVFAVLQERGETNEDGEEINVLSVMKDRGVIPYSEKGNVGNKKSENIRRYKLVRQGDIVLNSMNIIIGSVGLSVYDGCLSPVYYVLGARSTHANTVYLSKVFQLKRFQRSLVRLGNGILAHRMRIPMDKLKRELLPIPPPDEQDAIVRFLDVAERRIRRYIRAKQKLIKLLNEQKQAIIQKAVTHGLNPDAPMKDSGVEWLGEIPSHWDLLPVRRLISFITSGSRGWAKYYADFGDIFVQSGNIGRTMKLDFTRQFFVNPPTGSEGERTRLIQDDVVVCVTGALTGNVAHVHEMMSTAYVNQHVALLRPKKSMVYSRFLAYVLHSVIGQIQFKLQEYGGTKQGLSLTDVREVLVPTPPFIEQQNIVTHLDLNTAKIVETIENIQREIDCIREYRTRLIADVVTGKVDVRGLAFKMPEEFDDDDLLDVDEDDLLEEDELEEVFDGEE